MSNLLFEEIIDYSADVLEVAHSELALFDQSCQIYRENIYDSSFLNDGILEEETLRKGLSNLGKTRDGVTYAMLDARLVHLGLTDVQLLEAFSCLQSIDVSHNRLQSLDILASMEALISVNASNNQLTEIFNHPIKCATFLREINFSFNRIITMPDLGGFFFLSKVNLHGNCLTNLEGFVNCPRLVSLNVAHNQIESVQPLVNLPLQYLNVSFNQLTSLSGVEGLLRIQELIASGNKITSLEVFHEGHLALHKIDIENNGIIDLEHLSCLQSLKLLRDLNLRRNPIMEVPDYRLHVLFMLKKLTNIDGSKVDIEENVKAENTFKSSMEVISARDHRINCVNRFFKAQTVLYSTLQNSYTPYPMLVLVGPKGSGKKTLARKLVNAFPNFFGLAMSHTDQPTNQKFRSESDQSEDKDYVDEYLHITKEEFHTMRVKGNFLQTCKIDGFQYGLTVDAIEAIAREGLACVIDMELEGVLSLKKTHFEPRYVLTMPLNKVVQESRIRYKAITPVGLDSIVKQSTSRVDLYIETNQQRPGFFDKFICTDDLEESFINLKRLVMDYLGLTNEDMTDTRTLDANSRLASTGNLSQSRATASQQKVSSNSQDSNEIQGVNIEIESLQRRLNTAKAALTNRKNKDELFSGYKAHFKRRTSDFEIANSEDELSSEISKNATEQSDLGYKSPNCDTPGSGNELQNMEENQRDELEPLQFSNQSSLSNGSFSKGPRQIEA